MENESVRTKFIKAWNGLIEHPIFQGNITKSLTTSESSHHENRLQIEVTAAPIVLNSTALKQSMNGMSSLIVVKVCPHPDYQDTHGSEIKACGTSFDEAIIDLYKKIKDADSNNNKGAVPYTVNEIFPLTTAKSTGIYAKCPVCHKVITKAGSPDTCRECGENLIWPKNPWPEETGHTLQHASNF